MPIGKVSTKYMNAYEEKVEREHPGILNRIYSQLENGNEAREAVLSYLISSTGGRWKDKYADVKHTLLYRIAIILSHKDVTTWEIFKKRISQAGIIYIMMYDVLHHDGLSWDTQFTIPIYKKRNEACKREG
jgi:hypothetical protein